MLRSVETVPHPPVLHPVKDASLYLRQMAFLDFLTNLPNFNSLKKRHLAQIQIWKFDRF